MICMKVAINNSLMIVKYPYFDYFGYIFGKIERSEMAPMMLATPLDSNIGQSITLGSSPGMICMKVAINNTFSL